MGEQLSIFDMFRPCDYTWRRYIGQKVRIGDDIGTITKIEPYYTDILVENKGILAGTPTTCAPVGNRLPLGYLRTEEDVKRYKGDQIPFRQLEQYIGRRVLYEMPRQDAVDYKVIQITSYHKECDRIYNWGIDNDELIGTCDRIGYTDDNRKLKENSWVSEHFFSDGRYHDPEARYLNTTYQIREV